MPFFPRRFPIFHFKNVMNLLKQDNKYWWLDDFVTLTKYFDDCWLYDCWLWRLWKLWQLWSKYLLDFRVSLEASTSLGSLVWFTNEMNIQKRFSFMIISACTLYRGCVLYMVFDSRKKNQTTVKISCWHYLWHKKMFTFTLQSFF